MNSPTKFRLALMFLFLVVCARAEAADFPTATEDLVLSYRYLEARSQDFLEKFDQSEDPMSENNYADLLATRVLREEITHILAPRLASADSPADEAVVRRELKSAEVSNLPMLDDLLEALGHLEDEPKALIGRLETLYSAEERGGIEKSWEVAAKVRASRARAKNFKAAKTMETEIQNYSRRLAPDVVLPRSRKPASSAISAKYRPSAGPEGNLTGREFPAKMWALTYDDGPAKQTAQILDELQSRNLKTTFFWLSKNAPSYEKTSVARAKRESHGLANHSATHAQLTKLSGSGLDKEIAGATAALERIYGQKIGFFRLPYGAGVNSSTIRDRIAKAGMIHVYWNVDTLDWQDRNPDSLYKRTMKQINRQGRGVILFHDIHSQTVIASRRVMDELKSQGAKVVTMAEAVAELNGDAP